MKDFLILFRFELREMFALRESRRRFDLLGALVSLVITGLILAVIGVVLFAVVDNYVAIKMNKVFEPIARAGELLNLIYLVIIVALSWLSLVSMRKRLVNFAGKEVFLRLPVKSSTVFLSKLAALLLWNFICALPMIVVVNLIFYFVLPMPWTFWLQTALVALLLPLISFVIAAILLVPFIYIMDAISKRYLAVFLSLCAILMGAFLLYAEFLKVVQNMFLKGSIKFLFNAEFIGFLSGLQHVSYPANLLSSLALGENVLLNALICFGIVIVGGIVVYFITNSLYRMTLYKNKAPMPLPKHRPKSREHSPFLALLQKEFILVYREPRYVFSFFAMAMAMPVMIYSCFTLFETLIQYAVGIKVSFSLALMISLIFCLLTNTFCATNISRDGLATLKNKVLPVSAKRLLLAKVVFCATVSVASMLISALVLVLFCNFPILEALLLFALGSVFAFSHILIATRMDLNHAVVSNHESVVNERVANHTMSKTVVVGLLFALVIGVCALVFYFLGKAGAVAPWLSYLLPVLIALLYLGVALSYYIFRLEKSFHELVV